LSIKRPDEVRGSSEFASFYSGLDQTSYLCSIIKDGINVLRENMLAGDKVEKKKLPKAYVREYGITNLFRLDLDRNYRLAYTIVAEGMLKIVCILEVMDHKTYNERFGYG
jgi:hypothetical protein